MNTQRAILVVEDEENLALAFQQVLIRAGYEVAVAFNGKEGCELAEKNAFDMVLLDVVLPDCSGIDLIERFRKTVTGGKVFVILISAVAVSSDAKVFGLESGADGYLIKPIHNKELTASIHAFFSHQETLDLLKASLNDLHKIVQSNADAILIVDARGNVCFANPAAGRLFNVTPEYLLGTPFGHPILQGESSEIEIHPGNGKIKTADMRMVDIEWENEPATLATIRDISEKKEYENQLIEAREKAESSEKMKSFFLANMSHEIRTPLNAIIGFSELLVEDENDSAIKTKYYGLIKKNGDSLIHLISDILDLSNLEAGKMKLWKQKFDLRDMLNDLIEVYSKQILETKHGKVTLKCQVDHLNDPIVFSDIQRVKQVVSNLIDNAVKFTGQGSIVVHADDLTKGFITISVADTGPGIEKEHLEYIFKPFGRVVLNPKNPIKGTGLGLAIVNKIVENLQGDISVSSVPGQGATFTLKIKREHE